MTRGNEVNEEHSYMPYHWVCIFSFMSWWIWSDNYPASKMALVTIMFLTA